jgi:hypothetical protein
MSCKFHLLLQSLVSGFSEQIIRVCKLKIIAEPNRATLFSDIQYRTVAAKWFLPSPYPAHLNSVGMITTITMKTAGDLFKIGYRYVD